MTDFLRFVDVSIATQKTKRFDVLGEHDDSYLGYVYWRTGWRRYVMHFDADCEWSIECMAQCYKFITKLMQERAQEPKTVKAEQGGSVLVHPDGRFGEGK